MMPFDPSTAKLVTPEFDPSSATLVVPNKPVETGAMVGYTGSPHAPVPLNPAFKGLVAPIPEIHNQPNSGLSAAAPPSIASAFGGSVVSGLQDVGMPIAKAILGIVSAADKADNNKASYAIVKRWANNLNTVDQQKIHREARDSAHPVAAAAGGLAAFAGGLEPVILHAAKTTFGHAKDRGDSTLEAITKGVATAEATGLVFKALGEAKTPTRMATVGLPAGAALPLSNYAINGGQRPTAAQLAESGAQFAAFPLVGALLHASLGKLSPKVETANAPTNPSIPIKPTESGANVKPVDLHPAGEGLPSPPSTPALPVKDVFGDLGKKTPKIAPPSLPKAPKQLEAPKTIKNLMDELAAKNLPQDKSPLVRAMQRNALPKTPPKVAGASTLDEMMRKDILKSKRDLNKQIRETSAPANPVVDKSALDESLKKPSDTVNFKGQKIIEPKGNSPTEVLIPKEVVKPEVAAPKASPEAPKPEPAPKVESSPKVEPVKPEVVSSKEEPKKALMLAKQGDEPIPAHSKEVPVKIPGVPSGYKTPEDYVNEPSHDALRTLDKKLVPLFPKLAVGANGKSDPQETVYDMLHVPEPRAPIGSAEYEKFLPTRVGRMGEDIMDRRDIGKGPQPVDLSSVRQIKALAEALTRNELEKKGLFADGVLNPITSSLTKAGREDLVAKNVDKARDIIEATSKAFVQYMKDDSEAIAESKRRDDAMEKSGAYKNQEPLASKGTGTGISANALRSEIPQHLRSTFKALENRGVIRIAEKPEDLPASRLANMNEKGTADRTKGYWDGKSLWLLAHNMKSGDALGTFLHEGSHATMKEMLGKDYGNLVHQYFGLLNKAGDPIARRAENRATDSGESGDRLDSERLAYLVQEAVKDKSTSPKAHSLARRIMASLRRWFFKSPLYKVATQAGVQINLKPEDFVSLTESALKDFAKGKIEGAKFGPRESAPVYSKPPTEPASSKSESPKTDLPSKDILIKQAQDAIDRGATVGEVIGRMKELGLDPESLGYGIASKEIAKDFPKGPKPPESSGFVTGVKRSFVDSEREKRGLDAIEIEGKRSSPQIWEDAKAQIEKDPTIGVRLAEELAKGKRTPLATEIAILTLDRARIAAEGRNADRDLIAARENGDQTAETLAVLKRNSAESEMEVNDQADRKTAYLQSISFNMRKALSREDYSMTAMVTKAKAMAGRDLTSIERSKIQALHDKISEQEDIISKLQSRRGRRTVNGAVKKSAHQTFTDYAAQFRKLRRDKQLDCVA